MKLLSLALLATVVQVSLAAVFRSVHDLNSTNVCVDGLFNHSLLETNTSGWVYNATSCFVEPNSYVNISGAVLPILYQGVPVIPVGVVFENTTIGQGSALVIQGPLSNKARMVMPWFLEIVGNTFERNAQLRVIGSVPINSTITISGNTFDVSNYNPYLTDTLDRVLAVSIGGNLTTEYEPTSLYRDSRIVIADNTINVDTTASQKTGAGISVLSDIYFTDNTSVTIVRNKVKAVCYAAVECFGFETSSFFTLPEDYVDSYALLEYNTFDIKNGRGFVVPPVWSPNASFYLSASHNGINIELEQNARPYATEHAFTFDDIAAGRNTNIQVCYNVITSIGNTILYFAGALDINENAVVNCSWNDVFTTTGDPSVYFVDQMSVIDRAQLLIDNNRFQRQDNVAVRRPYLSLTYDFSVLGYAVFSFSQNECYPQNIQSGPLLAIITANRVANVGPTAFFAICGNIYNGNPADLLTSQILEQNVRSLRNCNSRDTTSATTEEETTTTAAPTTTTVVTTVVEQNSVSALCRAVAVAVAAVAAAVMVL